MEDDNALDIIKWMFKETTTVDLSGPLNWNRMEIDRVGGKASWQYSCVETHKCCRRTNADRPSEGDVDKWMLKLATSSHLHVQAELDQMMDKYYSRANTTAPFKKEHSFSVYQSVSVPSRKIMCSELFIKWTSEMRDDLLGHLWTVKNAAIIEALHNAVRHCNSNIEIYTNQLNFSSHMLGHHSGRLLKNFVLHFLPFLLIYTYNTFKFANGGLHKIRNKFVEGLEPSGLDHTNEMRYYSRRSTLLSAKRQIGELTRRIDLEWRVGAFGLVDKVGVQIFSEMKQLHETVCDLIHSFPNISNLVDSLCEGGYVQLKNSGVRDTLSNQLDSLEALMISLSSKMAVIDKIDDDSKGRETFEESAKLALNSTLDVLLQLVENLLLAQLLSLVVAFRKSSDCQTFYHIQLRSDLLLSQSVTLIATGLLANLENSVAKLSNWPPLVNSFSFLSCYGDEKGMMEDCMMFGAISQTLFTLDSFPSVHLCLKPAFHK
uniref:Uncharacterized protein n=1 Tax=Ditylenchus dipsaci TaxID=166011 RepID=A0A915D7L3_9BILA